MSNPWIQNISMSDCKAGNHRHPGENSVLIQIQDSGTEFITPAFHFKDVYRFEFMDCDETETIVDSDFWCQPEDAKKLVSILSIALDQGKNVLVHCHAGVCRSGAVVEVGTMMGFTDTGAHRIPNVLVKRLMMKELGWSYE